MRATLAKWFLWASVVFSGTLFGGALNEQLVIRPMWSGAAPRVMWNWARLALVLTTFAASATALSTAE